MAYTEVALRRLSHYRQSCSIIAHYTEKQIILIGADFLTLH